MKTTPSTSAQSSPASATATHRQLLPKRRKNQRQNQSKKLRRRQNQSKKLRRRKNQRLSQRRQSLSRKSLRRQMRRRPKSLLRSLLPRSTPATMFLTSPLSRVSWRTSTALISTLLKALASADVFASRMSWQLRKVALQNLALLHQLVSVRTGRRSLLTQPSRN